MGEVVRRHGGRRSGAGRKAGTSGAVLKALAGASRGQFVLAMMALGGDIDDARKALQLSRDDFASEFGEMVRVSAESSRAALDRVKQVSRQ